jgi:cellulose biosynthesis protein BcsQ
MPTLQTANDALDRLKAQLGQSANPSSSQFETVFEKKHPRSIAVINYKGGVGKTTATFFLGAQIAQDNPKKSVLIVDIDAQCSLTTVFGLDPTKDIQQSVLTLLKGSKIVSPDAINIPAFIKKGRVGAFPPNLYLLPGAFEVEDLDFELAQQSENPREKFFEQCRRVLAVFAAFDYILVDCPPNKMFLTQGMLRACRYYLVVAIPDKVSTYGIPRLLSWVDQIPQEIRPKLIGALVNRVIRTGSGITSEQRQWHSRLGTIVSPRALYKRDSGIVGNWPNSNKVSEVYGSGQTHIANAGIWDSTSRQAAVGDCVSYTARAVLSVLP